MPYYKASRQDRMDAWARGFVKQCEARGLDAEELVKQAQVYNTNELTQMLGSRLLGDSPAAMIGTTVGDMVTYAIPGIGLVRSGLDAASDFANVFQRGISAGDRWKYGLSGLGNTAFAAVNLVPGLGQIAGAAKGLMGAGRIAKATRAAYRGAAHGYAGARAGKGVLGTKNMAGTLGRYALGIQKNPYRFKGTGFGLGRGGGLAEKAKYIGFGLPRNLGPMAGTMLRPWPEGTEPTDEYLAGMGAGGGADGQDEGWDGGWSHVTKGY